MDDRSRYAALTDQQLQEVHAVCETFEQALQINKPLELENCLATSTEEVRTRVFQELIAIE